LQRSGFHRCHPQGEAGQEFGQTRGPKQGIVRGARYGEDSALGNPLVQRIELARAQLLQRHAVHDDSRHSVVSPPVRGQQLEVRVDHPQPFGAAAVQIIKIRIPAERQDQSLGSETRAKVNLGACQLPTVRAYADDEGMGQPLGENGEMQALA